MQGNHSVHTYLMPARHQRQRWRRRASQVTYFCPSCRKVDDARMQLRRLAEVEQRLRAAQQVLTALPRDAYTVFATEIHRCRQPLDCCAPSASNMSTMRPLMRSHCSC
jgi:hypothetical protein